MKSFSCSYCDNTVYFKNVRCLQCGHDLGFLADELRMVALLPRAQGGYARLTGDGAHGAHHYCANAAHGACNWLTDDPEGQALCVACGLNRTIPNLAEPGSLEAWQDLELAKKRLIYSLLRFKLPLASPDPGKGHLTFDFVRHAPTSHMDGVITIDIREADAVERERQRTFFAEPYRSVLGHLRHESGHFYWMVLVDAREVLAEFRDLFGDERIDYASALARHHAGGPPIDWQTGFVSAYASAHPWEDWAETWAHYLHMVDALDTAEAQGLEPRARGLIFGSAWPFTANDVYREQSFDDLMARWVPLTTALNSLSRSMGHADFYPFVISEGARRKLSFVHRLVRAAQA